LTDQLAQAFDKRLLETQTHKVTGMITHVHHVMIIKDQVLSFYTRQNSFYYGLSFQSNAFDLRWYVKQGEIQVP
jgi:hypothetical protein